MGNFKIISVVFFSVLIYLSGCKKEETLVQKESKTGPYVQRADGARLYAGQNRAFIAWKNADPNVSTVKLYWNNNADSLIYPVASVGDSIKVQVNNLAEGNYIFEVFTYDKHNVNSGKVLVSGYVFGETYSEKMMNRQLVNITYTDPGQLKLKWRAIKELGAVGTQVFYKDAEGIEQMKFVPVSDSVFTIDNTSRLIRGAIRYRTAYAPSQFVIDTLFTAFKTAPYINRQAYFDSLPGWKFRAKVFAEAQTVADFGGPMAFAQKMDSALHISSKRFQVAGINNSGGNQVHFYMAEMNQFTGASSQYTTKQWGSDNTLDFVLVVNDHAASGDDSWGWRRAPYLTLGHDYSGIFTAGAIDALVHELGHFRGMYDLYLGEVTAAKNPINGRDYESVRSVMNYPYGGETVWDEFSKIIFNASAGDKVAKTYWDFFPSVFRMNVLRKNNTPASGAQLRFYPVIQTSTGNEVRANDVIQYRATIGTTGIYIFNPANPFAVNQVPSNNIYNFLVEVIYTVNGIEYKEYAWMPMNDALIAGSKGLPYELKIALTR